MARSSKEYTRSYVDRPLKAKSEGTQESRMQLESLLHLKIPDSKINTIKDFLFSLTGERGQEVYTAKE